MDRLPDDFANALIATGTERGAFGARLFYFHETGSTNDLAAAAADRGDPEGTTFVAGAQTKGRGRLGRSWFSPPGAGLYVSTIVRKASVIPWITLAGGVTLERLPELAATGADYVSVGALTHSAPAADLSFELEPE